MSMLKNAGKTPAAAGKTSDRRSYEVITTHGPFNVMGLDGEGKVIDVRPADKGGVSLDRGSARRIKASEMRLALQVLEVLAVADDAPREHYMLKGFLMRAIRECPGLAAVLIND